MLIVLEGVDGAGKTTLTERLMKSLPDDSVQRMHSGPLKGDPLKEYLWRLKDYDPSSSEQNLVLDRWHVGELVYGPLFRGQSKLTEPMRQYVEMYLDKLGAYKLVVTANLMTILQRLEHRGEDLLKPDQVGLVLDFYHDYAHRYGWQFVGSDEVMGHITKQARRLRAEARQVHRFSSYVGSPHPRHLVVGLGTAQPLAGRPSQGLAFVPYADTRHDALMRHLRMAGIRDYGLADPEVDDITDLWRTLGKPSVVAVGPRTERAIRSVPHSTLGFTL